MGIAAPPPGSRLERETARLLGLSSRKGLHAASLRVAAPRVAAEGNGDCESKHHCSFFVPEQRKVRCDVIPAILLTAALAWWVTKTRVTANRKNIVKIKPEPPEKPYFHPVHWLEDVVKNFYLRFLESGPYYSLSELRVRGVSKDNTLSPSLRDHSDHFLAIVSLSDSFFLTKCPSFVHTVPRNLEHN